MVSEVLLENQKKRAREHYRDPSGRKPLNFHGVPFGDKSNVILFMDNPGIIQGSMDYPWIIHGISLDYPVVLSMDNPWIIHG